MVWIALLVVVFLVLWGGRARIFGLRGDEF